MRKLILLILLVFSELGFCSVSVALFEFYNEQDQLIQLEPGGRFYHVAISTKKGWLHSHPKKGVELIRILDEIGPHRVILTNQSLMAFTWDEIQPYLGLPFDYGYKWEDSDSTYCSKLIANLLKIDPLPMSFASDHWEKSGLDSIQELGLSPDDLFRILKKRGFVETPSPSCENLLTTL